MAQPTSFKLSKEMETTISVKADNRDLLHFIRTMREGVVQRNRFRVVLESHIRRLSNTNNEIQDQVNTVAAQINLSIHPSVFIEASPKAIYNIVYFLEFIDREIDALMVKHARLIRCVEHLPVFDATHSEEGDICHFCFEDLLIGDELLELTCKHVVHLACGKEILLPMPFCPCCRRHVLDGRPI